MKLAHYYRTLGLGNSASFTEVKAAYRQLVRQYHPDLNSDEQAITKFIAINEAYTALLETFPKAQRTASSDSAEAGDGAVFRRRAAAADRLNLDDLKLTLEKLGLGSFRKQSKSVHESQLDRDPFTEEPSEGASVDKPLAKEASVKDQIATEPSQAQTEVETSTCQNADIPVSTVDSEGKLLSVADQVLKKDAYEQLKALLGQQKFPRAIALVEGLANRLPTDLEINQWRAIVYQRWGRQLINEGQLHKARIYLKKALQVDPNNAALNAEIRQDIARLAILKRAL